MQGFGGEALRKDCLDHIRLGEIIILKWNLGKENGRAWTGDRGD
jgi:hypothetical protein